MSIPNSSKEYFGSVAERWEELRAGFFSPALRQKALEFAAVESGEFAADIGAGAGFMTEALLAAGLRVIAVDQAPEMLAQMQRRFAASAQLECRLGAAERLPLNDGEVDFAFANMFLHHVESPAQTIQEMARILKPGGKLVITDLNEHNFDFLRTEQYDRWLGFKREEVQRWFELAGLKNVEVVGLNEQCSSTSSCGSSEAKVGIWLGVGEK